MSRIGILDPVFRLYRNLFDPVQAGKEKIKYGVRWNHTDPHLKYRFANVVDEEEVGGHELGRGAFGVTYLAEEIATGSLFAVKVIRKEAPGFRPNMFEEEVDCLAAVHDHRAIVTLHEVYETEQYYFMFMEACRGGELFDVIISQSHFTEKAAAGILRAILEAVHHMHSRGIIHRDLKPENFLLKLKGPQGRPSLEPDNLRTVDFGLAARVPPQGRLKELVGTAYYIAPEVLQGDYSFEADVWSVGAVAYVLLCGCPPFCGKNEREVFQKVMTAPIEFPADVWGGVSDLAKDFVAGLLEREVGERMTVEGALGHPWLCPNRADLPLSPALLARLQACAQQSKLQGLLMNIIAKHVGVEQAADLQNAFTSMDEDGDGELTSSELAEALRKMGVGSASNAGRALLEALDVNGTNSLNYREFLAAAMDRRTILTDQAIAQLFSYLDTNGDGFITVPELNEGLKQCNISISTGSLRDLVESELTASNGKPPAGLPRPASVGINMQEFFAMLKGEMEEGGLDLAALEGALTHLRQARTLTQRFRQLALLVVTRQLDAGEVSGLRPLFDSFDTDHSGTISLSELYQGLKVVDEGLTDEDLSALVSFMDVDGNQCIDFHEFAMGILEEQELITEAKMRLAFDFFDSDGNGLIELGEVQQALKGLQVNPVEGEDYFLPHDPSQVVDFQEFRKILLTAEEAEESPGNPGNRNLEKPLFQSRSLRNAKQVLRSASSYLVPPCLSAPTVMSNGAPQVPGLSEGSRVSQGAGPTVSPSRPARVAEPLASSNGLTTAKPRGHGSLPHQEAVSRVSGTISMVPPGAVQNAGLPEPSGEGRVSAVPGQAASPKPPPNAASATAEGHGSAGTAAELARERAATSGVEVRARPGDKGVLEQSQTRDPGHLQGVWGAGPPAVPARNLQDAIAGAGRLAPDAGVGDGAKHSSTPAWPRHGEEEAVSVPSEGQTPLVPNLAQQPGPMVSPFKAVEPKLARESQTQKDSPVHNAKALKLAVDDLWRSSILPVGSASSLTSLQRHSQGQMPDRMGSWDAFQRALSAMEAVWVKNFVLAAKGAPQSQRRATIGSRRSST